ncbi:MAG: hypothetical protein WDO56_17325, partial [Gammaproteobacteria bacterium]
MKKTLARSAPILTALAMTLLAAGPGATWAAGGTFHLEEASIADIQGAIQSGERTCKRIVEEYIARAKVYNSGLCTALVTPDGKARQA